MKKLSTFALIAAASLGLAACGGAKPADNVTIENETVLNSEDTVLDSNLTVDETALGNSGDNVIVDNATDTVALNDTVANAH